MSFFPLHALPALPHTLLHAPSRPSTPLHAPSCSRGVTQCSALGNLASAPGRLGISFTHQASCIEACRSDLLVRWVTYFLFFSYFASTPEASRKRGLRWAADGGEAGHGWSWLVMVSMGICYGFSVLESVYIDDCPISLRRRDFSAFPVPEFFLIKAPNNSYSHKTKYPFTLFPPYTPSTIHHPSSPLSLTFGLGTRVPPYFFWGGRTYFIFIPDLYTTRARGQAGMKTDNQRRPLFHSPLCQLSRPPPPSGLTTSNFNIPNTHRTPQYSQYSLNTRNSRNILNNTYP